MKTRICDGTQSLIACATTDLLLKHNPYPYPLVWTQGTQLLSTPVHKAHSSRRSEELAPRLTQIPSKAPRQLKVDCQKVLVLLDELSTRFRRLNICIAALSLKLDLDAYLLPALATANSAWCSTTTTLNKLIERFRKMSARYLEHRETLRVFKDEIHLYQHRAASMYYALKIWFAKYKLLHPNHAYYLPNTAGRRQTRKTD